MPKYLYVLNTNTRRLHLKVDGRSYESCNLDQLTAKVESPVPPKEGKYHLCTRCMGTAAPIGPV
jgi:hypothetical protein